MKKWIIAFVLVLILAVSAFAFRGKLFGGENGGLIGKIFGKGGNKGSDELKTAPVTRENISVSVSATGTIEPLVIVEVRSKASGAITRLAVDEGDILYEGELIAEIEKTYTKADVDQEQANLKSAEARLTQAKTNIELQKKQSEIQIKQAQENVKDNETRLAKLKEDIGLEKEANERSVKQAENDLETAKLRLKQTQTSQPESLKRAETSVKQAKVSMELAEEEYNRLKSLNEQAFASKSEVNSAKAKFESAQAQYESAVEQLRTIAPSSEEDLKLAQLSVEKSQLALEAAKHKQKEESSREKDVKLYESQLEDSKSSLELALSNKAQIGLKEEDLKAAEASVTRAKVVLQAAQDRLDDTIVRAPISGTILEKSVEEGQVITSSMSAMAAAGTLLVTMADLENVYVKTEVDEADIGKIEPDQKVVITVDAFPDSRFNGAVLKIAPQGRAIQNVTSFEVTTEIQNPSNILKPGMNASVEIMVASKENVLVVPNEAIMGRGNRRMVFPVVDGAPQDPKPVETGIRGWDKTEITSGLEEGEVVALITPGKEGEGMPDWFRERMKNPMSSFQRMQGGGPGGRRGPGGGPPP